MTAITTEGEQIRAHHRSIRRLGAWTNARRFDIRASRGSVLLDLLLPELEPGEITVELDIDHSTVILLVPDGTNVDDDELRRVGRGRIKDWTGVGSPDGRTAQAHRRGAQRRDPDPPRRHRHPPPAPLPRHPQRGAPGTHARTHLSEGSSSGLRDETTLSNRWRSRGRTPTHPTGDEKAAQPSALGLIILWQLVASPNHAYGLQKLSHLARQTPGRQPALPCQPPASDQATAAARPGRGARDRPRRGLPRPDRLRDHRRRPGGRTRLAPGDARRDHRGVPRLHRRRLDPLRTRSPTRPAPSSNTAPPNSPHDARRHGRTAARQPRPAAPVPARRGIPQGRPHRTTVLARGRDRRPPTGRLTWSQQWLAELFAAYHPDEPAEACMIAAGLRAAGEALGLAA